MAISKEKANRLRNENTFTKIMFKVPTPPLRIISTVLFLYIICPLSTILFFISTMIGGIIKGVGEAFQFFLDHANDVVKAPFLPHKIYWRKIWKGKMWEDE